MTERQSKLVLFARIYSECGNATKAAIEAGYSPRTGAQQGSRLLRNAKVQRLIGGYRISRDVHGEQTYRNLLHVAEEAMALVKATLEREDADIREKLAAIECAGRQLERLGKAEGLFMERVVDEKPPPITLQMLAQMFSKPQTKTVIEQ